MSPLQARLHYFRAMHHQAQGDRQKEKQELEKALTVYPQELDALIARYHLPDQSDEYRKQTLALINQAAEQLEQEIGRGPEDPSSHNQYAWLIGNTEGDLDKALRYSRRAVELEPDSGGYLDTLAHVHFARGEYAEAVERQTRAAELEPQSKLIADKLEVFRKAMNEKGK
jgi:tetratricopeptide (TPR) repeat protein